MILFRSKRLYKIGAVGFLVAVNLAVLAGLVFGGTSASPVHAAPDDGGDTCTVATLATGALPYDDTGTTVGKTDDYDLPTDTSGTACLSPTTGTGGGNPPDGSIYSGTGTGPDAAYEFTTDKACTLTLTMDPTGVEDLALIIYDTQCTSSLNDCVVVSDTGIEGVTEVVTVNALAGHTYYAVVDGYNSGAGAYSINISGAGCRLIDPANEVCGVTAGGSYTFSGSPGVTVDVTAPGDINCIQSVLTAGPIPNGTANMTDGYYWVLSATNVSDAPATGFTVDLTFPHMGGLDPLLCVYTAGTGAGWDCAGTVLGGFVTRTAITNLYSNWAIGYHVDPTSVEVVRQVAVSRPAFSPWLLVALGLVSVGAAVIVLRKR